jgi:CRISPR-associated endonuclease Csn1
MPRDKAKRFAADGMQRWLKEDSDFLARALNDTAYLSCIAKEYLQLICPHNRVRAIPGRLTALLRGKFGLNEILSGSSRKNRDDHRHHAIDAVVVGVTDQGMLQRFARASASARERQLQRLVESMPMPWPTFREQVRASIGALLVSHRPDHNHEGRLHNDTAYGLRPDGQVVHRILEDGRRVRKEELLKVIPIAAPNAAHRHGLQPDGSPKPYKGYKGDSNFCMEITRDESGKWVGEVISTFEANRIARTQGHARLHHSSFGQDGRPLVMRIFINDYLSIVMDDVRRLFRIATISANGQIFMAEHFEANVDARNREKDSGFKYVSKMPGSLRTAGGRRVTVSPIGEFSSWVAR